MSDYAELEEEDLLELGFKLDRAKVIRKSKK